MSSKPVGTLEQIAEYLIRGYYEWESGKGAKAIKWTTSATAPIPVDLSRLDADGQYLARVALDMWTSATGLTFKEVSIDLDGDGNPQDRGIFFKYHTVTGFRWYQYDTNGWVSSSVRVREAVVSNGVSKDQSGEYTIENPRALLIFVHEIGHALGLGHPGPYDGAATYQNNAIFANDSLQVSVESYFNQSENTWLDATYAEPATPMAADILAIEKLYGDSNSLRTGDTVYGFNSNAGGFLDELARHMQAGTAFAFTLIDDGGRDTFDYSGATQGSRVDLNPGAVSDLFGGKGNMVIYHDTVVENFSGGAGADQVTGNSANNVLDGGGGGDTLDGGAGHDTLEGGGGDDTLTGGADADVFRYRSADFGADTITDFEDGADVLNFAGSGLSYADLTISVNGADRVIDAGGGNRITLTGQAGATIDAADIWFDGDGPGISIGDVSVHEGESAAFVVRLSTVSESTVSVDWRTQDGSALSGQDFQGVSQWQTLTFAPGETEQTVVVQVLTDETEENDENFTVELGNPVNTTVADGTGNAVVHNVLPPPGISVGDVAAIESDARAQVPVSLSRPLEAGERVTFKVRLLDGSAQGGSDYERLSASDAAQEFVIEGEGADQVFISRALLNDDRLEVEEHFFLEITDVDGARVVDDSGVVTIVDDEVNDGSVPKIAAHDLKVVEGEHAVFMVYLSQPATRDVYVTWHLVSISAASGADYEGGRIQKTLTIPAGQLFGWAVVPTIADSTDEADETFWFNMTKPGGAVLTDAPLARYALGTITETATEQPVVSIDDVTLTEGGKARFTVSLDRPSENGIVLAWRSADGTTTAGSDYTGATQGEIGIPAGHQKAVITVKTLWDTVSEADETFTVTLSDPRGGATLGDATGTATLQDGPLVPRLAIDDATVTVTEGGAAQLSVSLDKSWHNDVSFLLSTHNGTARAGQDYPAANGQQVTIPAGQTRATFTVQTLDDSRYEFDETFTVRLVDPVEVFLGDTEATVTIKENDPAPPPRSCGSRISLLRNGGAPRRSASTWTGRWNPQKRSPSGFVSLTAPLRLDRITDS